MAESSSIALFVLLLSLSAAAGLTRRQEGPDPDGAIVYERFHIQSTIVARYAVTSITSVALNTETVSKELSFQVQLPDTAFISDFTMMVNGSTFVGLADEKARAEREFEQRQQAGENVGLVESRGTNVFRIRINTAAQTRATFVLEYEELLDRRVSKYRQTINLNPGSIIQDFNVNVRAIDEQGIASYSASDFVTTTRLSSQEVMYEYIPSVSDQNDEEFGLARDMVIEFDVHHPTSGPGLIVVNDCYFAQFFSPSGVSPIPVDIVFVIDVSGSMGGAKIQQARESLEAVINQLRTTDRFSIVTFESEVSVWRNELVPVSDYRREGVEFTQSLEAGGGTNFAGGMLEGIDILKESGSASNIQLLVMLTDGQPTSGVTDEDEIVRLASRELDETAISLNTLGFGLNLNFQLLVRLALENRGIAQRIYEGEDAAEQLEGFYEEISSPILRGITVTYPPNTVEALSETEFPLLFDGSEIVIAGKFVDSLCQSSIPIPVSVSGQGESDQRVFSGEVTPADNTVIAGFTPSTERLVAYLRIQQTLDQLTITENSAESARLNASALAMALHYNFVTPLTSLIVVETNVTMGDNSTTTEEDGGEDGAEERDSGFGSPSGTVPTFFGGGGGFPGSIEVQALSFSGTATVIALAVAIPLAFLILLAILIASITTAALLYTRHKKRSRLNRLEACNLLMHSQAESTDGNQVPLGNVVNSSSPVNTEQSRLVAPERNGVAVDNQREVTSPSPEMTEQSGLVASERNNEGEVKSPSAGSTEQSGLVVSDKSNKGRSPDTAEQSGLVNGMAEGPSQKTTEQSRLVNGVAVDKEEEAKASYPKNAEQSGLVLPERTEETVAVISDEGPPTLPEAGEESG